MLYIVWEPCNSIPFPIAWTPFPPSQKIWEPCNSIPPPSHKASAATQSACLRILQSPFQAGNSSAHQKNPVWVPCSFFFSKTSGSVAARVWVPCNFIFFQAQQWQWKTWYLVWVPCNFILWQTYTVHELLTMLVWVPCNFTFLQAFKMLKSCGSSVWVPCNFIFFQTQCATDRRQVSVWVHVILSSSKPSKRWGFGTSLCSMWAQVNI